MIRALLLILIAGTLFGCGTTPNKSEPIVDILPISLIASDVSITDKNMVFKHMLEAEHGINRFRSEYAQGETSMWKNDGLIYLAGINMDYHYQYSIDTNNRLVKTTLNTQRHSSNRAYERGCLLCRDYGFSDYADALALDAAKAYNKYLTKFLKETAEIKVLEEQVKAKIPHFKVDVTTPLPLSETVKSNLTTQIKKYLKFNPGRVFYHAPSGRVLVYLPVIWVKGPSRVFERYTNLVTELSTDRIWPSEEPRVELRVKSGYYDLLPETFYSENDEISIVVKKDRLVITNKTNNFIDIQSLSIYWADKVLTKNQMTLSVPPQSIVPEYFARTPAIDELYRHINSRPYGSMPRRIEGNDGNPRFIDLSHANASFNYGFAVSYLNVDTNKRNTLLKKHTFTRSDFE